MTLKSLRLASLALLLASQFVCAQSLPFSTRHQLRPLTVPASQLDDVSLLTGDLDADGDEDFVFLETSGSTFLVMINQLDGLSSGGVSYTTGSGIEKGFLADVDADADLDLVVYRELGNSRQLSVHVNDGAGSFGPAVLVILPASTSGIQLAEINGDGLLDLIRIRPTGSEWLTNQGGILWQGAMPIPALEGDLWLDEDGDGDDDIIRSAASLQLIQNNAGVFSGTPTPLGTGMAPFPNARILVSNVDGDGDDDLVLVATSSVPAVSGMQVVRRTPQGWVVEDQRFAAFADLNGEAAVGDTNGDGAEELLLSRTTVGTDTSYLAFSANNGTGGLAASVTYFANSRLKMRGVACVDITGDGRDELVGALTQGTMLIVDSGSSAAAPAPMTIPLNQNVATGEMRFGDFDEDGELDAVIQHTICCGPTGASLVMSIGTQPVVSSLSFGGAAVLVQVADIDRDGDLDILGLEDSYPSSTIHVLEGDGAGGFTARATTLSSSQLRNFSLADFDGDGWVDIVSAEGGVRLIRNDGAGGWLPDQVLIPQFPGREVALGDLDQDGDLDFVAVTESCLFGSCSRFLQVCLNQGAGNFSCTVSVPVFRALPPQIVDVNGDGLLDVALVNGPSGEVLLSVGNGGFIQIPAAFAAPTALLSEQWSKDWSFGDLDGDGNLDAACEGGLYLRGDGTGTLTTEGLLPISGIGNDIEIIDVNRDMQPDIVYLDERLRSLVVILNETPCPSVVSSRGLGCPGTGGFAPRLRLAGCAGPAGTTTLTLDQGLPGSSAWLYFGPTATDLDFGMGCRLFVDPASLGILPINLAGNGAPGQGTWEITLNWPASITPGFTLAMQGVSADPMAQLGLSSSNGLVLTIP